MVPETVTERELAANLKQTAGWERRRDLPDVVALRDIREELDLSVGEMSARLNGYGPLSIEVFPFPNPPKQPRRFCIADPLDEIVLRTATGRVAVCVDQILRDAVGVHVFSHRLAKRPPGWTYKHHSRLQRARRALGRQWIEDPDFSGLGITDVSAYYPSVDPTRLTGFLLGLGGDAHAAAIIENWLSYWRSMGSLGLPIGIEASGLLGTAFLIPADRALAALGLEVIRVTDDFWVLVDDEPSWDVALGAFDGALAGLGLNRNVEKTQFIAAPDDARALVRELASAEFVASPSGVELDALRDRLEEAISADPIDGQSLRFAVGGLCRVGDRFMIDVFAKDPSLIQHAPRRLGDCLCHDRAIRNEWAAEFFPVLEQAPLPETEAVDVSILRGAGQRGWGRAEELFANIAFDPVRPQFTRAWALEALSRTPAWSSESAFGLALTEGRPCLQRAATLSFRSHVGKRANLAAVTEIRRDVPSLAPTSSWVQRFAA